MEDLQAPESTIACPVCYTNAQQTDAFCGKCGYPLKGSKQEQEDFKQTQYQLEANLSLAEHQIRRGGMTLYILSGITFVAGILLGFVASPDFVEKMFGTPQLPFGIVLLVLSVAYLGLGLWSRQRPFAALLIALILYCTLLLMDMVADPVSLFKGIIWKVLIIVALVRGTSGGYRAEKIKKELHIKSY